MKSSEQFLRFIHEKFEPNDGKILFGALSREKQLWQWLISSNIYTLYEQSFGRSLQVWTPAKLGVFAVLREEYPDLEQSEDICQKFKELSHSFEALSGSISSSLKQHNIPTAVKIAYLIRYQFEKEKNFQFLSFLSLRTINSDHGEFAKIWQLVFAILDSVLTNETTVYQSVLRNLPTREAISLICHAMLCQPVAETAHESRFLKLFNGLPLDVIQPVLSELHRQQARTLVRSLARKVLPDITNVTSVLGTVNDEIPFEQLMNFALTQHQNAKSLLYRDQSQKAIRCFTDTQQMLARISAGIQFEIRYAKREGSTRSGGIGDLEAIASNAQSELFQWDAILTSSTLDEYTQMLTQFPAAKKNVMSWIKKIDLVLDDPGMTDTGLTLEEIEGYIDAEGVNGQKIQYHTYIDLEDLVFRVLEKIIKTGKHHSLANKIGMLLPEMGIHSSRSLILLADSAYAFGDYDTAKLFGNWLLVLNPENPVLHRNLGKIAASEKRWDDAMMQYRDLLARQTVFDRDDWLFMAKSAGQCGEYAVMLEASLKILEIYPNDADAHTAAGLASLQLGSYDKAAEHFNKALETASNSTDAWLGMAELYEKLGDHDRIEGLLQKAISYQPDDHHLLTALGTYLYRSGQQAESISLLRQAIEMAPESIEAAQSLIRVLWETNNIAEIESLLQRYGDFWEVSPEVLFYKARLLSYSHRFDEAIPFLTLAITNGDYDLEKIHCLIDTVNGMFGNLLFTTVDQMGEIHSLLMKVVDLGMSHSPDDFLLLLTKAQLMVLSGETASAEAAFRNLSKFYESNLPLYKWQIQAGLGLLALRQAQVNQAMAAFQSARSTNPEEIHILMWLAEATWMAQLEPQALVIADQVCELADGDRTHLEWYFGFLKSCGESTLARKKLVDFIATDPDHEFYRFKALEFASEAGDTAEMQGHMEKLAGSQQLTTDDLRKLSHYYEIQKQYDMALRLLNLCAEDPGSKAGFEVALEIYRVEMLRQEFGSASMVMEKQTNSEFPLFAQVLAADAFIYSNQIAKAKEILLGIIEQPGIWQTQDVSKTKLPNVSFPLTREEIYFHQCPAGVFLRLALVQRLLGEYREAVTCAEKALAFAQDNPVARYYTLMLMKIANDEKRLSQLPRIFKIWFETGVMNIPTTPAVPVEKYFRRLVSLMYIDSLYQGEKRIVWEKVKGKFNSELSIVARGLMIQAKMLKQQGEWHSAQKKYQECATVLQPIEMSFNSDLGFYSVFALLESDDLWFMDGAIELGHFHDAWIGLQKYFADHKNEEYAVRELVRLVTRLYHYEVYFHDIGILTHLPSQQVDFVALHQFTTSLLDTNTIDPDSAIIKRLHALMQLYEGSEIDSVDAFFTSVSGADAETSLLLLRHSRAGVRLQEIAHWVDVEDKRHLMQMALSLQEHDPEQGLTYAKRALGISPGDPISRVIYAMLSESMGDYHGTLHSIEAALSAWPEEWYWREWAANAARNAGEFTSAMVHLELLNQHQPGDVGISLGLVSVYLETGQWLKGLDLLDKAGDFAKEVYRNRIESLYVLAHHKAGNENDALAHLSGVICEDENSLNAILAGAAISFSRKEYDSALKYAKTAYEFNPKNPLTLVWLAKILKEEGHTSDAVTLLRQIDSTANSDIIAEHLQLVRELSGEDEYLRQLENASAQHNHHPQLLYMKAIEAAKNNHKSDALSCIRQALREDGQVAEYHELAGSLYRDNGQLDQAIYHFAEALKLQKNRVDLYLQLAKVHILRREPHKALEVFHQGIQQVDDDYRLYYESALILREAKKYKDAEVMFTKALKLQPMNDDIRNQLGAVMALNFVHNSHEARR